MQELSGDWKLDKNETSFKDEMSDCCKDEGDTGSILERTITSPAPILPPTEKNNKFLMSPENQKVPQ